MKKITIEEKAKRYDEAFEKAMVINSGKYVEIPAEDTVLEYIFPELAESEDEKIRKKIIYLVKKSHEQGGYALHEYEADEMLAWLEKQGEKPQGKTALEAINEVKVDNSNSVSFDYEHATITQKDFAPKEDPKFHEGDWVASNICNSRDLLHIIDVDDNNYEVETPQGNTGVPSLAYVDNHYHLWTIEDAKPGDVLVNGSNIFIFHFLNDTRLMGYCHVNTNDGRFYDDIGKNECFCLIDAVVTPATKEQRDLLFQKMKEAGYEWDVEKKELKEIEQEDEEYNGEDYGIDSLYHAIRILEKTLGEVEGYQSDDGILEHKCAITAIKKLYNNKLAEWSEEDICNIENIDSIL